MKIAVVHNLGPGGARRALMGHLVGLRARGHHLSLFAPRVSEQYEPIAPLCDEVTLWGPETEPPSVSAAGGDEGRVRRVARQVLGRPGYELVRDHVWAGKRREVARAIGEEYARIVPTIAAGSPDLVYVQQCQTLLVAAPVLQGLAGRVPLVLYLQDTLRRAQEWPVETDADYDGAASSLLRRRDLGRRVSPALVRWRNEERHNCEDGLRALQRPGARLLVNSYYSRESLLRTSGVEGHVCYLGVNGDFFTPSPASEPREPEVLSVGALRPEKRHDRIIAALGTIAKEERPRLRIVGYRDGPGTYAEYLESVAERHGVSLSLDVEVSDEKLREAYRRARMLVFAPYLEPFGLVVLEALACGTPVVAVREGGPREIVRDGETGLLTGGDPREIGAAVAALLRDPAGEARMGQAAREQATRDWTWDRSVDTLEAHFADVRQEWTAHDGERKS